jgi:hypothetical protein
MHVKCLSHCLGPDDPYLDHDVVVLAVGGASFHNRDGRLATAGLSGAAVAFLDARVGSLDNEGEVGSGDACWVRGRAVEGALVLATNLVDNKLGNKLKRK